jgi:hypothetical protein
MQEDDQRRTESAGALKGLFSWSLPEGDEVVLEQISDCDPLSHSEGTTGVVPGRESGADCARDGTLKQHSQEWLCCQRLFRKHFRLESCRFADFRQFCSA